jgi:hypothetical protein
MLKKVTAGIDGSSLDKELWLSLLKACHFDEAALKRWHIEFERRAPDAHHKFLLNLGLCEKEALQIRMLTKNIKQNTLTMKYFYELFEDLPRQGPGCREATLKALDLLADLPTNPKVLDIGCGCDMQTQLLAQELRTKILAIDNHRPVLDCLDRGQPQRNRKAQRSGMARPELRRIFHINVKKQGSVDSIFFKPASVARQSSFSQQMLFL